MLTDELLCFKIVSGSENDNRAGCLPHRELDTSPLIEDLSRLM